MKKVLSLILSLVMIASISAGVGLSVSADIEDDRICTAYDGDYAYDLYNDGTAVFYYNGTGGEVTVPSVYHYEGSGYTVTALREQAFYDTAVTVINIPASVTSIGDGAFSECSSLSEINIDENNSVYSSSDGVLFNKDKTELLKYPQGNKRTSYTVPDGVISIVDSEGASDYDNNSPFMNCDNLEIVNIPNSVEYIGNGAFMNCDALFEVNIGNGLKTIGNRAFCGCGSLSSIILPDGLTSIGYGAFGSCETLSDVKLPKSLEKIGAEAFYGCENLSEITIPQNVADIEELVFSCCSNLAEINVDENNLSYSSQDGILFNKDKTNLIKCPEGSSITSYTIPQGVNHINDQAFLRCGKLSEVTFSDSVQTIGQSAFSETGLTEVLIPDNVTLVDTYAFFECASLESITIMNPDCNLNCGFEQSEYTFPVGITIYGYAGSTAQEYVKYNSNMGFKFAEIKESAIEEDTDTEYTIGSSEGAMIHCTYDLADFVSVAMDGKTVDPSNYTLAEGSTILTFKPAYLDTLSTGKHTVKLNYTNATATSILTVKAAEDKPADVPDKPSGGNSGQTNVNSQSDKTNSSDNVTGNAGNKAANTFSKSPDTGASFAGVTAAAGAALLSGAAYVFLKKKKQ